MGAGKWKQEYTDALLVETGLTRAFICIDKDDAGYEHAADIRDSFKGTGVDLRFVKAAGDHHDVSDHLAAGARGYPRWERNFSSAFRDVLHNERSHR